MTTIQMKKYGRTLTDRPDGKKTYNNIVGEHSPPLELDFSGVVAMGSSFGDEVVMKIARMQGNAIRVLNANNAIRDCVSKIIEDTNVEVDFGSVATSG